MKDKRKIKPRNPVRLEMIRSGKFKPKVISDKRKKLERRPKHKKSWPSFSLCA